jgi:hypothetical protein
MNFDEAIRAHSDWKRKLSGYIATPDGSLKPEVVCLDNKCDLGKWIYSDGSKFSADAEYKTLKEQHAKFHIAASEVIKKVDSGISVSEEVQLGGSSDFSSSSSAVVLAIMKMKMKAGN